MPGLVQLSGITKQIMPGPSGDIEEWLTQEVNVTRGEAEGPGIICFVIPDSCTFSCTY